MKRRHIFLGGLTGRARSVLTVLIVAAFLYTGCQWYLDHYDPLYASIEEDPCYEEGVYRIYDGGDYVRFAGYMNRARKEEPENEEATAVDAVLMADVDLSESLRGPVKNCPFLEGDLVRYRLRGHPYIRQAILNYAGTFDGGGHTLTWGEGRGNGMFVCIERGAVVKNLTFCAEGLSWDMDEYGVGLLCMMNYGVIKNCRTEGSIEGTECYVGGFAGINRGIIEDCVNQAEVTLKGIGEYGAGGIAGLSKCKVLDGESEEDPIVPRISRCVNEGTIRAPWEAGGICARNDCANIDHCGNEGEVTVQYQRGYVYPDHPDWYERAMAAGICGDMGWNSIENCYNGGPVSILEEGEEATYGIAGGTLSWVNEVTGCVSLKGTAVGSMRHESVMELTREQLEIWKEDPGKIPYRADNWQFDLEEAREKLSLLPLSAGCGRLNEEGDRYLCGEFCLLAPKDGRITEVSPYALCVEGRSETEKNQMWVLRLPKTRLEEPWITIEEVHDLWLGIEGSHWLHPSYSYKDDCHVETHSPFIRERVLKTNPALVHYRDDYLAGMAVGYGSEAVDNVAVLPLSGSAEEGYWSEWLLLFTSREDNRRPDFSFVYQYLDGFRLLPGKILVSEGDSLLKIAGECTGDPARYPELADANGIPDPDHILAGQILTLPDAWMETPDQISNMRSP